MVIGAVLLQPQRLERARHIPADDAVLHDIIGLALRLLVDGVAQGGRVAETLAGSFAGTVVRLATRTGAGVNSAVTRFGTLLVPFIASLQDVVGQPPGEVSDVLDGLENGITSLVHRLNTLTPEQIRQGMKTVFEIVETDLGITPTFIRDLILGVFDDMILALASTLPNETPDERASRRVVSAMLRRLQRYMQAHFTFPAWNADVVAQALITLRQNPDVDAALTRALCSSEAAVTYLRTGGTLLDLLPYSAFASFGEGSLGAAAAPPEREEVSFYASKLLEYDNYDGDLGTLALAPDTVFMDGPVLAPLREAFLPASVVLARTAFLYTVDENEKWQVFDRKKYLITRVASNLWVYRLFEVDHIDFLQAQQGDQSELRKIFRQNGLPGLSSSSVVVHVIDSNSWDIQVGGIDFIGTRFEGTVTIRPKTLAGVLFVLPATLQPAATDKTPAAMLRQAFESQGIPLSPRCRLAGREPDSEWLLDDGDFIYTIKKDKGKFEVSTGDCWGWLHANIGGTLLGILKGNMVWVNRERTQVLLGQRIMHTGSNLSWHDAPVFKALNGNRHYSLKNQPTTVEGWAYHTAWIQDIGEAIIHAINIGLAFDQGKGEYSVTSNSLNIGRMISEVVVKLAQHRPMAALVGSDYVYDLLLNLGTYVVKGIEALVEPGTPGPPTTASDFSKVVDKILSAIVGVEIVDTHWSEAVYECILSFLTLLNHLEPAQEAQTRPENYKENGGFVDVFWKGGLLGYTAAIPDAEYALPFQTTSLTAGYWLGGAFGVGLVMGFVGLLIGQGAVANVNVFADGGHLLKTLGKSTGKSLLYFWPYLKLVKGKNT